MKILLTIILLTAGLLYFREDVKNIIESESFQNLISQIIIFAKQAFVALQHLFTAISEWFESLLT